MVKPNRLTGLVKRRRILITIRSKNKHSSLRSATATEVCTRAKRESTGWRENDVHLVHFDQILRPFFERLQWQLEVTLFLHFVVLLFSF